MLVGLVKISAIPGIPDIQKGDNLGIVIGEALDKAAIGEENL